MTTEFLGNVTVMIALAIFEPIFRPLNLGAATLPPTPSVGVPGSSAVPVLVPVYS